MRYRLLGSSDLRVSEIALGTMTFSKTSLQRGERPSPGADWAWCASEDDARSIFAEYLDRGGNFIDTADVYAGGTAEPLVGELIAPVRDRLIVATKYGLPTAGVRPEAPWSSYRTMARSVEESLRRLATDRIDLLWLHAWDGVTPLDEIAQGFQTLIKTGKVRYAGISDTPAWAIAALHTCTPITAIQLRYSALDRAGEIELLPMARHFGIASVAFGILGGGALTGATSARRATSTGAADVLRAVGDRYQSSPAQIALAWIRARTEVLPIIGARTPQQLRETLGRLDLVLSDTDMSTIDELARPPLLFPHDVVAAIKAQADPLFWHSR